jgi:hypothetical protein
MPVPERDHDLETRRKIMADLYAVASTVDNTGATQATFGSNARRAVISYPGNAIAGASPYTQFGTRELVLLKATASGGTPFAAANIDDAGSDYAAAINAIQGFGEVFHVQRVSDTVIAFMVAANTVNGAEPNSNVQADTYGAMEAALNAAVSGSDTFTVAAASIS